MLGVKVGRMSHVYESLHTVSLYVTMCHQVSFSVDIYCQLSSSFINTIFVNHVIYKFLSHSVLDVPSMSWGAPIIGHSENAGLIPLEQTVDHNIYKYSELQNKK